MEMEVGQIRGEQGTCPRPFADFSKDNRAAGRQVDADTIIDASSAGTRHTVQCNAIPDLEV